MNMLKAVGLKRMAVVVAGVVAVTSFGEYGTNPSQVSQDISRIQPLVSGASNALSSATQSAEGSALSQGLKAAVEKAETAITNSQKELKWRRDNEALREKKDKLKLASSLPALLDFNIAKRRDEQNQQLKTLFTQMNQQPASQINPQDFDMSGLEAKCSEGVDFNQFRSLADQMNSQPFQYLRTEGQKILQEKDKLAKEEKLKTLARLAKEFDKAADQEDQEQGNTSVLDQSLGIESRLEGLKADNAQLKSGIKDLRKGLVKSLFSDFIPKLSQIEENDQRIGELANNFANSLEAFRKASHETALANVQRLRRNCEKIVDRLGKDNPLAPGSLFNAAYQYVVAAHAGDADFYANREFLAGVTQVSQDLRCSSSQAMGTVDSLLGGNLQNSINQLRSATDPTTLLQGAMSTLQAVSSAQAQVGPSVRPLMNDCDFAAKQEKKVKKFISSAQQQLQQQQSQDAQGGASRIRGGRTSGTANGANGVRTHRAGQVR